MADMATRLQKSITGEAMEKALSSESNRGGSQEVREVAPPSCPEKFSIFPLTDHGDHDSLQRISKLMHHWADYLSGFERTLGGFPLPYEDNEMSAIGSLASAITRSNPDSFIVCEKWVNKSSNSTGGGRCDLFVHLDRDTKIEFEAKMARDVKLAGLRNRFIKDESPSGSDWSLVGRGFRDVSKSTGNQLRVRSSANRCRVMLLMVTVQGASIVEEIAMEVHGMFDGHAIVRTRSDADGDPNARRTSRKPLHNKPSICFIYAPKSVGRPALVATATLI